MVSSCVARLLITVVSTGAAWTGGAFAHDVWITVAGPATAPRAVINYGHPHDRPPTVADKITEVLAISKNGQESLIKGLAPAREGQWSVVETPFYDDGHTLLAVRYNNGYFVKTADGYRNGTNREVPDAIESFRSVKFGKALIDPGGPWDKVLGHDLEIVPLSDPLKVRPGQKLSLRVLFHGQPLARGQIERGDGVTAVPEADIPRFATDSNGEAEVPIVESGPMQLVIDHDVSPSSTPDLAKTDSFNATLWYRVPR